MISSPLYYEVPLLIAAAIATALALLMWQRRPATGAAPAAWIMVGTMVWSVGYALEIGSPDLQTKLFWTGFQYLGIVTIPATWLVFSLQYTGRGSWLAQRRWIFLIIEPVLTLLLLWTNQTPGIFYQSTTLSTDGAFPMLEMGYGPWAWLNVAYTYVLLALGIALIFWEHLHTPRLYRAQNNIILIGALAPWAGNALYMLGITPTPRLDLTPFAFTITGISLAWGLHHFQLLDIVPIACTAVVKGLNDGIIVLDQQDRVVNLNPAAQRIVGHSLAEVLGRPAAEVLGHPEIIARYRDVMKAHEEIVLTTEGAPSHYDLRISPLRDSRDNFIGRLFVLRDTNERLQVEAKMRQLSLAVEQSPGTVVITDTEGNIEYVNPKFTELTGYTLEEVQGENPRLLKSDQQPPEFYRELWDTITQGRTWHGEFCNHKKDGSNYWELASISPLRNVAGEITHFVKVAEDITERRLANDILQKYTEELEARNAELDAFAHTVAHDLKNPLTSIIGFSDVLEKEMGQMSSEQQRNYLHFISQSGDKMTAIIDELLLLARLRDVKDIVMRPLDTASLIAETQKRLAAMIEEYQPEIIVPDKWPEALGYGPWIEEVWTNYFSNAIKYGGHPPRIECGATPGADGMVRFWVRDNGPGLTPEEQSRLFAPFERLQNVRAQGHGLGLSIVRHIVEKLGGQVGTESEMGRGSLFYFTLPQAPQRKFTP